ncbi:hypothetical protein LCGC14_1446680 [marine sediment metagenome]|uniref:Uncharacterized protein n=1 Tax=marine sediment metagenome TaxID=412755 RepID=A0A0F9JIY8_9ZZZZ
MEYGKHNGGSYHESGYRGVVKGINEDYDDPKLIRLDVAPSSKPKKRKGGLDAPMEMSRSETVSMEMGNSLKVGDRVEVMTMIRKVRQVTRRKSRAK